MFEIELLAPAGDFDKLRTVLLYGANAVYLGGQGFNLRASAGGFSPEELPAAVALAAQYRAKVYYCLNSFPYEEDLPALPGVIEEAAAAGVQAFIVADPGVFSLARRYAPGVEVHLSTQANTTSSAAVRFWAEQGVTRVNLARELNAAQIHALRKACPEMELEVFAHGALCLALSGQCLLSAWLNKRPANQGLCTQPCRFDYRAIECRATEGECAAQSRSVLLEERTRPGEELWELRAEERHAGILAPQELCLLPYLPWFISNRINAVKLEGRMKGTAYAAHVTDAYSSALKALQGRAAMAEAAAETTEAPGQGCQPCLPGQPGLPDDAEAAAPLDIWPYLRELRAVAARPMGTGFFLPGRRRNFTQELQTRAELQAKAGLQARPEQAAPYSPKVLARVVEQTASGVWRIDVLGQWRAGSNVELMLPGMRRPIVAGTDYELEDHKNQKAAVVNSGLSALWHCNDKRIQSGIFVRAC